MKHIYLFLVMALFSGAICAQKKMNFKNGEFKIIQFTDLHWTPKSKNCNKTKDIINKTIEKESPDIAVLTGDVVTESPAIDGWKNIIQIFNEKKLPFVVTLGNHDGEFMTKDSIYNLLSKSPYYIGEKGPKDIYGYGNCIIPIFSGKKIGALLYCFDSNDYLKDKKYGEYDYIHNNQIQWYRKKSDYYTRLNGGHPIPSLAFFHIPLVEMKDMVNSNPILGNNLEKSVASSNLNSGLYASMVEKQDIMGVFTGHDHDNDYIGLYYDIALGYGRVTGLDAYGNMPRGARMIKLYAGKRKFDTWVTTPNFSEDVFYYPSGLNSGLEHKMYQLPALSVQPKGNGVRYKYYEGVCKKIKDINSCKLLHSGVDSTFSIQKAKAKDHFAFEFEALISIPESGVYKFFTYSDDGSQLYIDNHLVVDNDGGHSIRRKDGLIALEKGFHKIIVKYFEDYMGEFLEVGFESKNIKETKIPSKLLFIQ